MSTLASRTAAGVGRMDMGSKSQTDVKVDNSDQNIVTGTINLEQSMGTIFLVFTILLILYCCKYGFQSICDTAKTHFGRRQKQELPIWYPSPPRRPQPPRPQRQRQEEGSYFCCICSHSG